MLPGADPAAIGIVLAVAVVVAVNTLVSSLLIRIGERPSGAVKSFLVTLAVNIALVVGGQVLLDVLPDAGQVEHAVVFVLLLSVIVTGYDRYRPLYKARFADGPLAYPGRRGQTAAAAGDG
jgi:hypothetical protein